MCKQQLGVSLLLLDPLHALQIPTMIHCITAHCVAALPWSLGS
jgi:hypothetical protein